MENTSEPKVRNTRFTWIGTVLERIQPMILTLYLQLVIYDKPYFTGKSRTITANMRDFMTRVDRQQTAFMYSVGSLKVLGGMWVHCSFSLDLKGLWWVGFKWYCSIIQVVRWYMRQRVKQTRQTCALFDHVPLSAAAAAGSATRRRASEDTSTCWRRGSTTTGGCGGAAILSCAPSGWSER